MNNRVYTASAGTGKTYSLSLEYIAILLKHCGDRDFDFKNIVVITFTRKATAEIRDAIFERLKAIFDESDADAKEKSAGIIKQIEKVVQKDLDTKREQDGNIKAEDYKIGKEQLVYLKTTYDKMLREKDKISISTIDSFISTIFKTLIAPQLNITTYEVMEENPPHIYEKLFENLLACKDESQTNILAKAFERLGIRNKDEIEEHFGKLIDYRWLYAKTKGDVKADKGGSTYEKVSEEFIEEFSGFLDTFSEGVKGKTKPGDYCNAYIKVDIIKLLEIADDITVQQFKDLFISKLKNEQFLSSYNNFKVLLGKLDFWDGRKLSEKTNAWITDIKEKINDPKSTIYKGLLPIFEYLFLDPEKREIYAFWGLLLEEYDKIKLEERVLTFNDLLWFTYSFMYEQDCPLYDKNKDTVTPEFYESLAMKVQYMLIDEFQDTSVLQFEIFKPILNEIKSGSGTYSENGIIIVGDEKQSIYGWRGGEKSLLKQMESFIYNSKKETLGRCYRSNGGIVDFINAVFEGSAYQELFKGTNQEWVYENVKSNKEDQPCWINRALCLYSKAKNASDTTVVASVVPDKSATYERFIQEMEIDKLDDKDLGKTVIIARTNKELVEIEKCLIEANKPFIRQSSSSLFDHDVIKAMMNLLRFLAYDDWKSLLAFLRSDLILLDANKLAKIAKQVAAYYKNYAGEYPKVEDESLEKVFALRDAWHEILLANRPTKLSDLMDIIIERFQVTRVFANENQLKNLFLFLQLVKEFDHSPAPYDRTLDNLLLKLKDLQDEKSEKQQGVVLDNAIQLMTIHKSKGLSFRNVFVYLDISARDFAEKALFYYEFDKDEIGELNNYTVTSLYRSTLLKLDADLNERVIAKENIEDMNNVYVALTRPETNLGVYMIESKSSYDDTSKVNALKKLRERLFAVEMRSDEENFIQYQEDTSESADNKKDKAEPFTFTGAKYFKEKKEEVPSTENIGTFINKAKAYSKQYLNKRPALRGNVAHKYLEYIFKNTPEEKNYARKMCIQEHANLMLISEIEEIIETCDQAITNNAQFFSEDWDKIYNEYTIFDNDKMYRIDRLLISDKRKEIMILDFKTGSYNEEQLQNYKSIIESLPIVKEEGYIVDTYFLEV